VDVITGITGADKVPLVMYNQASPKPGQTINPGPGADQTLKYNPTTVKTIVEGLQVLGTLLPPPSSNATPAPSDGSTGTSLNGQQQIVILAATAQQAEAIKFSQMDGTISLVLRSVTDCQTADGSATSCPIIPTTGITLRKMVDDFGVLPPQIVEVIQPTPYPNGFPTRPYPSPSPIPSASPSASASTAP
jgi:hypothetical protein